MIYPMDYEPSTDAERGRALIWFRQMARNCNRLILVNEDPSKTPIAPGYTMLLTSQLNEYRAAIERLVKMDFRTKKEKA